MAKIHVSFEEYTKLPLARRWLYLYGRPGWITAGFTRLHGPEDAIATAPTERMCMNLMLEGGCRLTVDERCFDLYAGDAFVRLPGQTTATSYDETGSLEFFVAIDKYMSARLMQSGLLEEVFLIRGEPSQGDVLAAKRLYAEIGNEKRRLPDSALLLDVVQFIQQRQIRGLTGNVPPGLLDAIGEARRILEDDTRGVLSIREIAARVRLPYDRFRRVFRETVGTSPRSYRMQHRLAQGRELLVTHSVAETAEVLGFSDPFTFSRQFKAEFGRAPKEFKRS